MAEDGPAMTTHLTVLKADGAMRVELARRGLETILARHTCAHRTDELLAIVDGLMAEPALETVS